jgi:hypothetical protein
MLLTTLFGYQGFNASSKCVVVALPCGLDDANDQVCAGTPSS